MGVEKWTKEGILSRLTVMDGSGDTELRWDPLDPDEVEAMRATVETLRTKGFVFFLVDGRPADEVTAGNGGLVAKRIQAEEVVESILAQPVPPAAARMGRRRKSALTPDATPPQPPPDREVLAHRPMRGG